MNESNITITNITTPQNGFDASFATSVFFVFFPGCVFNIIALFIIAKDFKTLLSPTNTLLFLLCLFDFVALLNAYIWVVVDIKYQPNIPTVLCQVRLIFNPLFLFYTGLLSLILAVDRYIALNFAFFYQNKITSNVWLVVSFVALLFSMFIGALPLMGYGTSKTLYSCSGFTYTSDPLNRVFGITQPSLGLSVVVAIVVLNTLTIRTVLQMKRRIIDQQMGQSNLPSHEILFANLVTVMTLCFVICWTPFNLINLLQATGHETPQSIKGFTHSTAGLSFCLDPLLYVWIRKSVRKKLVAVIRNCNRCKSTPDSA